MFCPKCNKEMPEGYRFCLHCGQEIEAPVEAVPAQEVPAEETPVREVPAQEMPAEEAPFSLNLEGALPEEAKTKKKKNKLLIRIIAGVTALAVLVVCLLGFFAWDWGLYVRDMFERMKSPEDYMDLVEQRALSDENPTSELGAIKKLVMSYYTAVLEAEQVSGGSVGMQVLVGDGLKDLLDQLDSLGMELDADVQPLLELLQVLNEIELRADVVMDETGMEVLMDLGINSQDLIGAQVIVDTENNMMYMDLPGLTDTPVAVDLTEMGLDPEVFAVYTQSLQLSEDLKADLPSAEAVSQLLDSCLLSAMEQITEVERENGTIKAGGVEQNVTVLTYEVDEQTAVKMGIAILEQLEDNETLLQILEAYETYAAEMSEIMEEMGLEDAESAYPTIDVDAVMASISDAIAEMEEYEAESEQALIIETYVNKKGQIVGRSFTMEDEEGEIAYMTAISGRKVGFKLLVEVDGEEVCAEGSATYKKGKLSGTGSVEISGEELLTLELKELDVKTGTGVIRVGLGKEVRDAMEESMGVAATVISSDLELEITIGEKAVTVWLLMDDDQILGLGMDYAAEENATVTIPSDAMTDPDAWAETMDPQVLLDRLEEIGITEEMLEALVNALDQVGDSSVAASPYYDYSY